MSPGVTGPLGKIFLSKVAFKLKCEWDNQGLLELASAWTKSAQVVRGGQRGTVDGCLHPEAGFLADFVFTEDHLGSSTQRKLEPERDAGPQSQGREGSMLT